jgi:hypothetical protein
MSRTTDLRAEFCARRREYRERREGRLTQVVAVIILGALAAGVYVVLASGAGQ